MGFMDDMKGLSELQIASAVLNFGAFLLQTIGFASPNWQSAGSYNSGLWRYCFGGVCNAIDDVAIATFFTHAGIFKVAQLFETLAFVAILAGGGVIILQFFYKKNKKILYIVLSVFLSAALLMIIIGLIIYATVSKNRDFGFAFYFCLTSAVTIIIEDVVVYHERRTSATSPS